ncbi:MAG TPA: hypothetical protein VEX38_09155, partial [Fimbriimonadaceae bacterium]|nr:hypothetical protein [Fimbriimonadaceae bacterium]
SIFEKRGQTEAVQCCQEIEADIVIEARQYREARKLLGSLDKIARAGNSLSDLVGILLKSGGAGDWCCLRAWQGRNSKASQLTDGRHT